MYQIYASQVANIIAQENPNDGRSIIVGIALMKQNTKSKNEQEAEGSQEEMIGEKYLLDQVESMVRECRVWWSYCYMRGNIILLLFFNINKYTLRLT